MRFDVVTLFPELFAPFMEAGVARRAYASGQIELKLWNLRDFAEGNYRRVDDRPFGGGPGMVMLAEPLARCLQAIQAERADAAPVVLFSPIGAALNHAAVERWSAGEGAVLICGRYEGVAACAARGVRGLAAPSANRFETLAAVICLRSLGLPARYVSAARRRTSTPVAVRTRRGP